MPFSDKIRITLGFVLLTVLLPGYSFAQNIYHGGSGSGFNVTCFAQADNPLLNIYNGGTTGGFAISCFAQADNPLYNIYQGGNEDGFALTSFAQADNVLYNIYQGGSEDGFTLSSFAQADDILFDIYKGGTEDGFTLSSFAQADNVLFDIYKGGIEDGFTFGSFMQTSNVLYDIYNGGTDDGFAISCFAQADNILYDIYKGGVADGFSFSRLGGIGTEVALPVQLVLFEGKYLDHQVLLHWKTASELNNDFFVLERSSNGSSFASLYKIAGAGTSPVAHEYNYADESPREGINYYRLKQVDFDGKVTYSNILSVYAESSSTPVMFIVPNPSNPVNDVRIQLEGVGNDVAVEISITNTIGERVGVFTGTTDGNNNVWLPSSFTSNLAGGLYVVSVTYHGGKLTAKWMVR